MCRPHLTLHRGCVHACTPTHPQPHSFYKGLYTHPPPLILQGSLYTSIPTYSTRVYTYTHTSTRPTRIFTYTYTPLLILQGSLHIPTHSARVFTHTHTPTHSTRVFTHTHTHIHPLILQESLHIQTHPLILQGSLHTHTSTHSKGSLQRTTRDLFRFQPVFFTSTAGSLSSGQKGPCPQSGQKVTGMEPRRTSPVVPGQRALALPAACF